MEHQPVDAMQAKPTNLMETMACLDVISARRKELNDLKSSYSADQLNDMMEAGQHCVDVSGQDVGPFLVASVKESAGMNDLALKIFFGELLQEQQTLTPDIMLSKFKKFKKRTVSESVELKTQKTRPTKIDSEKLAKLWELRE